MYLAQRSYLQFEYILPWQVYSFGELKTRNYLFRKYCCMRLKTSSCRGGGFTLKRFQNADVIHFITGQIKLCCKDTVVTKLPFAFASVIPCWSYSKKSKHQSCRVLQPINFLPLTLNGLIKHGK